MNAYTLPDLPYDFGALEPHLSARILELHHGKHHAAYVKNANLALEQLQDARMREDWKSIAGLERALAFHLSGHLLHSLHWTNLAPGAGGQPQGALASQIAHDFGTFERFRAQLDSAAASVMGSGWGALVWEPGGRRLLVTQILDHSSNHVAGTTPLMVADAWEHAYYLQYEDRKRNYLEALWNLWNWPSIAERFENVAGSGARSGGSR